MIRVESAKKVPPARKRESCLRWRVAVGEVEVEVDVDVEVEVGGVEGGGCSAGEGSEDMVCSGVWWCRAAIEGACWRILKPVISVTRCIDWVPES